MKVQLKYCCSNSYPVFFTDAEFRTLAQSLDPVTLVGLARTYDADMRLFLQPPPLIGNKDDEFIGKQYSHYLVLHQILQESPTFKATVYLYCFDEICLGLLMYFHVNYLSSDEF